MSKITLEEYFAQREKKPTIPLEQTPTYLAKEQGFIYDEEIQVNEETKSFNAYLMATDNLMARFGVAFEQKWGKESLKEVLEAIEYNGEVPNFYAFYDLETNVITDNLVSCAHFTGKDGMEKYMYVDIPLTKDEVSLLKDALNEYCIKEYILNLEYIAEQTLSKINYSYDPSFETDKTFDEIEAKAIELYDAGNRDFSCFNNGELYQLYKVCLMTPENPYGQSYDDEVFDEIDSRNGVDGKELSNVFYEMYMKENYLDPAYKIVDECKDAYANGNMSLAYEKWSELHSFLIPEGIANASTDFQNKMYDFYSDCMNKFSDEEVYNITDYGKAHSYSEMEEER